MGAAIEKQKISSLEVHKIYCKLAMLRTAANAWAERKEKMQEEELLANEAEAQRLVDASENRALAAILEGMSSSESDDSISAGSAASVIKDTVEDASSVDSFL